jgi:hypothetical protein
MQAVVELILRLAPLGTGCDLKEPDPGPVQSY